jgi:cytochrome c
LSRVTRGRSALLSILAVSAWMALPPAGVAQQPAESSTPADPAAAAAAQAKRGRLLYLQCRACHELRPAGAALAGPHLGDLLGRKVAAVEGFDYSAALRGQAFAWDRARLDAWLAAPGKVVPGNTMAFAGIASAEDRAALIAYLESATRAATPTP